jgi:hypothetical protein
VDPKGILPGSPEYEKKNKPVTAPAPAPSAYNSQGETGGNYGYSGGLSGYASGYSPADIPSWKMTDIRKYGGQGWNPFQKRVFADISRYAPEARGDFVRGLQGYGGYGTGVRM